jgi:hypothetical protein
MSLDDNLAQAVVLNTAKQRYTNLLVENQEKMNKK